MSQWKNVDQANGAPNWSDGGIAAKVTANGQAAYANTTANSFIDHETIGVYGVDTTEAANTAKGMAHAGWVERTAFQGPVKSVTVVSGGASGYTNGAVTFGAGVGNANAAGTQVTNGSGVIVSVNITAGGMYVSTPAITANGAGSGANLQVVMGGRANRVQLLTLVAMGSMTASGSTLP